VVAAVFSCLESAGLKHATAKLDSAFSMGMSEYRAKALEMLSRVEGDGPTRLLLRAMAFHGLPPAFSPRDFVGQWERAGRWLSRPTVALAGPVNAGKSTLFNKLASNSQAIVSPEPGTTRDTLSSPWALPNGCVVTLLDTPGTRDKDDAAPQAERDGHEIGTGFIESADLVLRLTPADGTHNIPRPTARECLVITKADLKLPGGCHDALVISAHANTGLDALSGKVANMLFGERPSAPFPLNEEMAKNAEAPGYLEKLFRPGK